MPSHQPSRRKFLLTSTAGALALTTTQLSQAEPQRSDSLPAELSSVRKKQRIFKSVKWGMIESDASIADKFAKMKSLGFDGIELESPGLFDWHEILAASEQTGMPVHGVVNMRHWKVRLSAPKASRRDEARETLLQCIYETARFGGSSVLLVPGKVTGTNETHDHVWQRSIAEIRKVLPLASRLGIRVLIENVWNGFCESPEVFRDYLDEINSPWVGAYFDIGNAQKFAPSEHWIETLGSRIVKLDIKGWGSESGFCKIGSGDINWPAVRTALTRIGFTGWATAEVNGGGWDRLAEIGSNMDTALGL